MTPHKESNRDKGSITAVLISLLVIATYLFMTTRSTLWDRDEPRYARVTVEMVESGNYMVPTFNGESWLDKPVLMYWLMSLPVRLWGPSEFACRFFSAIGSGLTCFLTFLIGRKIFGTKTGLWAMVILATTLMMLGIGTAAVSDALLLPFILAVMLFFIYSIYDGMSVWYIILMGIALGLGMLTKGPIGFMPIPVIVVFLLLNRKSQLNIKQLFLKIAAAVIVGFIILAAWAIPVNNATGGEFVSVFLGRHVLNRALTPMESHGGNFWLYLPYYIPVIIAGFFPWTLHLAGSISAVLGKRTGGQYTRSLFLSWAVTVVILMTLAATKLPHYILFIWPVLALVTAGTLTAAQENKINSRDKLWLQRGGWFFTPVGIGGALALIIGPWFLPIASLQWPALACGIILMVMSIIAIRLQLSDRPQASAVVLLAGIIAFHVPYALGVLPAVEKVKISPPIAKVIVEQTSDDTPVATYKYAEPTLNFYIGRYIEPLSSKQSVIEWSQLAQPGVLIIPRDKLEEIQEANGTLGLVEIASVEGFNYSKGDILDVLALLRGTSIQ